MVWSLQKAQFAVLCTLAMTVAEAKGEYFGCLIYQLGGASPLFIWL